MLITPEYVFKDVTHITPEWLAEKGITALVPPPVLQWGSRRP